MVKERFIGREIPIPAFLASTKVILVAIREFCRPPLCAYSEQFALLRQGGFFVVSVNIHVFATGIDDCEFSGLRPAQATKPFTGPRTKSPSVTKIYAAQHLVRRHPFRRRPAVRIVSLRPCSFWIVSDGSPIIVPMALLRLSAKILSLRRNKQCVVSVRCEPRVNTERSTRTVRDEHHGRTLSIVWTFPFMRTNRFCVRPIGSIVRRRDDHIRTIRGLLVARAAGKRDRRHDGDPCCSQRSLGHEVVVAAPIRSHSDAMRLMICDQSKQGVWMGNVSGLGHPEPCSTPSTTRPDKSGTLSTPQIPTTKHLSARRTGSVDDLTQAAPYRARQKPSQQSRTHLVHRGSPRNANPRTHAATRPPPSKNGPCSTRMPAVHKTDRLPQMTHASKRSQSSSPTAMDRQSSAHDDAHRKRRTKKRHARKFGHAVSPKGDLRIK